jgi:hypothetical protein
MAAKALSRDDLALGRLVLLATDAIGMAAEGAFWLYDREDAKWRYFLISTLFEKMGPRELYLKLNEALSKTLSEREARDFSIYIASPKERLAKNVGAEIKTSAYASEPVSVKVRIGNRSVAAWIYRFATRLDDRAANRVRRRFAQRTKELAAA